MSQITRPRLAITMGDPAGIGPEIVLKALAHADVFARCRPLVIGGPPHPGAGRGLARADSSVPDVVANPAHGAYQPGRVTLLHLENAAPDGIPVGEVERRRRSSRRRLRFPCLRHGHGRGGGRRRHRAAQQSCHAFGRL